jgi:hypothetical protein
LVQLDFISHKGALSIKKLRVEEVSRKSKGIGILNDKKEVLHQAFLTESPRILHYNQFFLHQTSQNRQLFLPTYQT